MLVVDAACSASSLVARERRARLRRARARSITTLRRMAKSHVRCDDASRVVGGEARHARRNVSCTASSARPASPSDRPGEAVQLGAVRRRRRTRSAASGSGPCGSDRRSALDGERGRHVGVDLAVEGVRRPARRARCRARTSRPPSASRGRRRRRRRWRCAWRRPRSCSTISSPGATVRSVSEKSSATIVPPRRPRRPSAARAGRRSGVRWRSRWSLVSPAPVLRVVVVIAAPGAPARGARRRSEAGEAAGAGRVVRAHGRGYGRAGPVVHGDRPTGGVGSPPGRRGRRPCRRRAVRRPTSAGRRPAQVLGLVRAW